MFKNFCDLRVWEGFNTTMAHIIEGEFDYFPGRPLGLYMKISNTEAIWLRTGQKREFDPNQNVKVVELVIAIK